MYGRTDATEYEGNPPSLGAKVSIPSYHNFKKKNRLDLSWTSFLGHSLLNAQAR